MARDTPSVVTGPDLGVAEADILPADEAVCAVAVDVRDGLVSCALDFRDLAARAGAEEALLLLDRASCLLGEVSRDCKGDEEAVDVCVAGWED